MINLIEFKSNAHSQHGEDGILNKIFETLEVKNGVFCEFGAWNGMHLSNTYRFCQQGWAGWYIEGDSSRYQDLLANVPESKVEKICAWVAIEGPSCLDNLLQNSNLYRSGTTKLDLLSIDIDSDDLAIWKSLKRIRPRVVIIEFNPNIPYDVFFENPRGHNKGNSARAIYDFACSAGYELIGITACNLIFIDKPENNGTFKLIDLFDSGIVGGARYFFGFDGTLIVSNAGKNDSDPRVEEIMSVPWNGGVFLQPVAKPLRIFGRGSYYRFNFALSIISVAIRRPAATIVRALRRLSQA